MSRLLGYARRLVAGFLLAASTGLAGWGVVALAAASSGGTAPPPLDSLVLLHTNDTHGHLLPFSLADGTTAGGAAARAARIARDRARSTRTLLLDGGDVFQGTPFYNYFRGAPDYEAMTAMGYDAGALGNHDLDDGPVSWRSARRHARFEILSANAFVAAESTWADSLDEVPAALRRGARWIGGEHVPTEAPLRFLTRPSLRREAGDLRIALFGLTTPDAVRIVDPKPNGGVAIGDPVAIAKAIVPGLRSDADLVVCLSHLGVDADRRLAERVPGIDVIVGGHTHTRLNRPILVRNGTPNGVGGTVIVQAGYRGELLGRLTLYFKNDRLAGYRGQLLPILPSEGEDAGIAALLHPYAETFREAMDRPVFHSTDRVTSSGLRDGETALGNFVADAMLDATGAEVALINSGGIRAPLPAGEVSVGDLWTMLPFDNRLVVISMPGWRLREILDFAASRLGKGGFAQVAGVSFVIRRARATEIRVGGRPIDSDRVYRVATVDYLYRGGDGYTLFAKAAAPDETGVLLRDAAVRFLEQHPDYRFRKESRIRWEGSTSALRDLQMR